MWNDSSPRSAAVAGEPPASAALLPLERPNVWVVDDSPVQLEMAARALESHFRVVKYGSGAAVLEDLTSLAPPDTLVLDWQMPDVTGLEVCGFVRSARHLAQLPVVMLTVNASEGAIVEALAVGANDFVKIPFSPAELVARIATLVRSSRLHAELAQAEHRLRVEADFRERFMGMLAHDLRQPLNTMLMVNELVAQASVPTTDRTRFLEMQWRAGRRMQRMLLELLDFTRNRPESGMPLAREATDLAAILDTALAEIRPAHPEHEIESSVEGACQGHWDPDRLAQLCSNLIGNATEHGPPGCRIQIRLTGHAGQVQLRVSNPGRPIPASIVEQMFRPFWRGANKEHSSGSVGLGLHIVQQIVTAHSGTIEVHGDDARVHFVVTLPREPSAEAGDGGPISGYTSAWLPLAAPEV